jgi:hypothetical protein
VTKVSGCVAFSIFIECKTQSNVKRLPIDLILTVICCALETCSRAFWNRVT